MARAKLDDAVIFEIKSYRSQKVQRGDRWIPMPLDEIEEKMQEARDSGLVKSDMPGRGSIQKYAREYDDIPDAEKRLDEPFTWSRISEYDLPWESGGFLLKMEKAIAMYPINRRNRNADYRPAPRSTVREALWWWRVHLTDLEGKMTLGDVWSVTKWIVVRELMAKYLNQPRVLEDIEAYLSFKPWIEGNDAEYEAAIVDGRIPGMNWVFQPALGEFDIPEFLDQFRELFGLGLLAYIGNPNLEQREFIKWNDTMWQERSMRRHHRSSNPQKSKGDES